MSLGQRIAPHLPFLRRYARALSGTQEQGDAYVRAALEAIVAAPDEFPDGETRSSLYTVFQRIWDSAQDQNDRDDAPEGSVSEQIANSRLARISPLSRRALLLTAMEGFSNAEAATILGTDEAETQRLVDEALGEIDAQTKTRVLIIEDEPIIAMDIETIVRDLGHEVTGIAVTRDEAVAEARATPPGLVLADIQLADNSSGIDAVQQILSQHDVPVIFITAFPERLLTGDRPEPAFLITKPFQPATVKAAIAQALFFNSNTIPA